ncbi:MAG: hypothetical protein HYT36_02785 [Candidatus Staskawiczbacteria bacterium]|nr:hypothetical protein [Candidatus Staskawiczbacteria bacterium]
MEHKLVVEFLNRRGNFWDYFTFWRPKIVQTIPFEMGFLFKNIGENPIKEMSIKNIKWQPVDGKNILSTINKSFNIGNLNPDEERKIWVQKLGTYAHGLCSISFNLELADSKDVVKTFQIDPFTKLQDNCSINSWIDFFFIFSKSEYEQGITNKFLLSLTTATVVMAFFSFALTALSLNLLKIQTQPILQAQEKNMHDAETYCTNNPDGEVPKSTGGAFKCSEILEMLNKQ